ncbi:MAG: NAD(P)-binding domain-containing protein, partial [Pseudomonadota bacterium]
MQVDEQSTVVREAGTGWPGHIGQVAIVGCGYVGSCLVAVLCERGVRVRAIDADAARIAALRYGLCPIPEPGLAEALSAAAAEELVEYGGDLSMARSADVVIVTVGTPIDQPLRDIAHELAQCLRPGQLIILKSTVPPGSARALATALEDETGLVCGYDFWVASSPERLAEGEALAQLRELPVVVGGVNPSSTAAAVTFWRALGLDVERMSSAETAEAVKLASNWWIDANIALAN